MNGCPQKILKILLARLKKKKEAELRETAKIEQLRKKLYVPLTRKDHLDSFSELAWVFSSL